MATLNIPTTEAKELLKFKESPAIWFFKNPRPILNRLPFRSGAYVKDMRKENTTPAVLTGSPFQCKVSLSDEGRVLILDAGFVVWDGGSAILPRTTVQINQIKLSDGLYIAGFRLDEPQQHFLDDENPSLDFFHIILAQVQIRGNLVTSVVDLRVFTDIRQDPVAHWITDFQDNTLESLKIDITQFGSRYMSPFTAGYHIYKQLSFSQQEIHDHEHRNQIPSRLNQSERLILQKVRQSLNWVGQLLGFNDISHLSLADFLHEKRLLMAGVFGQYGFPGKKHNNLNPTRYDLFFKTKIITQNQGGNSKKQLKLQTEDISQLNKRLDYSESNPIDLFVGGLYSFDKPIKISSDAVELNSDYILTNNNKSLQILKPSATLIDLKLQERDDVNPIKVRFTAHKYSDRSNQHRGLWGAKGSKEPHNYCLDSLGISGFEEDYGIDFNSHHYSITPEKLVELAGLRPNKNTRKFIQSYKFQLNQGNTGETSRPTPANPTELNLIDTRQNPSETPSEIILRQKNNPVAITEFTVDYQHIGKKITQHQKPQLDWLLDPLFDNGEYDETGGIENNEHWVDVDGGDTHDVETSEVLTALDEGEYRYKSVQPNCSTSQEIETSYDGGTFYHSSAPERVRHGIDGGISNHVRDEETNDPIQDIPNIESSSCIDGGLYEFEPYVTIDNGEVVNYPAIYHEDANDITSFSYRIHDNYDGKGGYYFEVLTGGKITAAIGNSFIEIKIPPDEAPAAEERFPVPYLGIYLHTLDLTGKVIVGIKDYSIRFRRGGRPDVDSDNNDFIQADRRPNPDPDPTRSYFQYTWETEDLNYSTGENRKIYELAVYTDQTRPDYALDIAEIELVPVPGSPSERRVKNEYEQDIKDLRRFTTHNRYNSNDNTLDSGGPTLDNGIATKTDPEYIAPSSNYDEGLLGESQREGIPYTPPETSVVETIMPCPSEPIPIPIPAFTGLQWQIQPDSRHTTTPAKLWTHDQVTVGYLAADSNLGTQIKHQYRHFLRLPPNIKRGSNQWDKAFRAAELFSNFSSTVTPSVISKNQTQPNPTLYRENLIPANSDNSVLYDEPFLISNIQTTVPLGPNYREGSIQNQNGGTGQWSNSQINEYDPIQTRKLNRDPDTDEYAGQYYCFDKKAKLSGITEKDIHDGKIIPCKTPPWEKPSPTTFKLSVVKDKLKNYGICYAYFGADLSAAEEPVFDPDNPICWATNSQNQVPSAYQ